MPNLITHLRCFNRKERYILMREALGPRTFSLDAGFRRRLSAAIGTPVPKDAFVAMDYHLDWLQMALFLARKASRPRYIPKGDVLAQGQETLNKNQMDIDLLVAFEKDATTYIVLLEAKMETGWSNAQMGKKASRLRQIFDGEPASDAVEQHFVLLSPTRPRRLETDWWPGWMTRGGKPVWMKLPRPDGLSAGTDARGTDHSDRQRRGTKGKCAAQHPRGPAVAAGRASLRGSTRASTVRPARLFFRTLPERPLSTRCAGVPSQRPYTPLEFVIVDV